MELGLSLGQKQVLSQQMQLSVKILQMNTIDLEQYIRDMAIENPVIDPDIITERTDPADVRLKKLEWLDRMDDSNSYEYRYQADDNNKHQIMHEKNASESLRDVLLQQLPGFHIEERQERLVRYLIDNLDENGYLTVPREELERQADVCAEDLTRAIETLQKMEPAGVGGKDLKECLLLQVSRLPDASPVLSQMISDHLDDVAKNKLAKLAKSMRVSIDEIKQAHEQLLLLNPKPGNGFSAYKSIPYIKPDLFIVRFADSFQVIVNDSNQPRIVISNCYRDMAKEKGEAAAYIKDNLKRAAWLISCIEQRKNTILKCASSILQRQMCFFISGPGNMAPMTLSDVAGDLDMHPSTISRAVQGKYLQCQWGVFPLSNFFVRNVTTEDVEQSQDRILDQIKKIIAEEPPKNPYSDQEISDHLGRRGIKIARRTVAKYRELLGIPSSNSRKEY